MKTCCLRENPVFLCYFAKLLDGDTADIEIVIPFLQCSFYQRLRFAGINAWEIHTKNKEEKQKGLEALAFLTELIEQHNQFYVEIQGREKYGRLLGNLYFINSEQQVVCLNQLMVEQGHAMEYHGGKKPLFPSLLATIGEEDESDQCIPQCNL